MKALSQKIFLLLMLIGYFASAQQGIIRGTVYEESSGEPLFGVAVKIAGTTNGAVTDFDGKFQISADAGTYDVEASFISFKSVNITGLEVEPGEATIIDAIWMQDAVEELEAIVVTAEVIKNSESALLTVKRKSTNVMDGISSESFRKIGDANAGEAARRVTGVSVEGGKYIYVRGLGDRYTKTTLNGLDIPGLDPDRNSIQIDVFPTNLIDNMVVMKSFTPDLPADFTGGIVNIETKDFPEQRVLDVSASVSYNPTMHFNNDYISYDGSSTDIFGFDNGDRQLPDAGRADEIPSPFAQSPEQEINEFLNEFSPILGASQQTSFMDVGLGLTFADQRQLPNGHSIGYMFSGNYSNSTRFYDNVFFGEYQIDEDPDTYPLVLADTQDGIIGENNVLLGGLGGIAYKTQTSKFKFNIMHLQNGESRSGQFDILDNDEAVGNSGFIAVSDNLEYNQRGVTNFFLNGEHYLQDGGWRIDWRGSTTISSLEDPDIRKTPFSITGQGESVFNPGAAGVPTRLWRELEEVNNVGKVDITKEYTFNGSDAKLKFGVLHAYKERDYEILAYRVRFFGSDPDFTGDPNQVWTEENLFPNGSLMLLRNNGIPNPNQYNSTVNNTGFYVSNEFTFAAKFRSIVGVRAEKFVQRFTGRDQDMLNVLDDEKLLDALDFFPSVNLIYALQEQMNLRVSFSRTIARPSFKELSFAQILDPVSNRTFNGGLFPIGDWDGNLEETRISNFDLRWELFQSRGQLLSVSGFYKTFDQPIELVRIPEAQTNSEFQPRNVGDGRVIGVEVEFRQSLEIISSSLSDFSINGNVTIVDSEIKYSETELRARSNFEKTGQDIGDSRDMAGQAPWIINTGLQYVNPILGLDAGFFYNVKGETLTIVGGGLFPDVYTQPFHSLNFNLNKSFVDNRLNVNVSVNNILDDDEQQLYQQFRADAETFQRMTPGTSVGIGLKYSF